MDPVYPRFDFNSPLTTAPNTTQTIIINPAPSLPVPTFKPYTLYQPLVPRPPLIQSSPNCRAPSTHYLLNISDISTERLFIAQCDVPEAFYLYLRYLGVGTTEPVSLLNLVQHLTLWTYAPCPPEYHSQQKETGDILTCGIREFATLMYPFVPDDDAHIVEKLMFLGHPVLSRDGQKSVLLGLAPNAPYIVGEHGQTLQNWDLISGCGETDEQKLSISARRTLLSGMGEVQRLSEMLDLRRARLFALSN